MKYSLPLSPEDAVSLSLEAYGAALASCNKASERLTNVEITAESFHATHLLYLDKACQVDLAEAAHNRCFDL
jgi:hypothetical protein